MRAIRVLAFFFSFLLSVSGCTAPEPAAGHAGEPVTTLHAEAGVTCVNNGFEMSLYADKRVYQATEKITIWSTLIYRGGKSRVTIWHGEPYMVYSITGENGFRSEGVVLTVLTSTVLTKGTLYHFDYQKSGGWDASDPDAAFWESFYAQKDLFLPKGDYTVTLSGSFSLSKNTEEGSGLLCELPITVV